MDFERKLRLILAIECKLNELDTSYTYNDIQIERYEWNVNVISEICEELGVDYNKYQDKTIRDLEKDLIEDIIYPDDNLDI